MFWKKKETPLKSDEYEVLYKKFVAMVGDIDELKAKTTGLNSQLCSLRSTFNQHRIKDNAEEKTEDLNNSVLLTSNGVPVKSW